MPMFKKSMLLLIVLFVAALGGTLYGLYGRESAAPLSAGEITRETPPANNITVYVTGAVNKPSVVSLAEGSRVVDAVNACGGLLPTADSEKINMAQELKDGGQVRVPEKTTVAALGKNDSKTAANAKGDSGLVNINTADETALDTLPGIGPAMAKRIIEYRQNEGAFQAIEDIKKVKGIGEAKFNKLKDKICI